MENTHQRLISLGSLIFQRAVAVVGRGRARGGKQRQTGARTMNLEEEILVSDSSLQRGRKATGATQKPLEAIWF